MRRVAWMTALGAAVMVGGCSSGEDVYIETGTVRGANCALSRGEDVCARRWDDLPDPTRTEVVTWLDAVTTYSSEARAMLDDVDAACTEMLAKLGIEAAGIAEGSPRTQVITARCGAVTAAIRLRKTTRLTVGVPLLPCTTLPVRSCVLPGSKPRRQCVPPRVTLEPTAPATDADRNLVLAIEDGVGRLVSVDDRARGTIDLIAVITKPPERDGRQALPDCLVASAAPLLSEAGADMKAVVELSGELLGSLDAP